jgi:general secretion pathway protein K
MITDRRGFALVTTLWILVVLTGVLLMFEEVARFERRAVANAAELSRAHWAARAAVAIVLDRLDRDPAGRSLGLRSTEIPDSAPQLVVFSMNDLPVTVSVEDTRARLHLNLADGPALRRMLAALGISRERASALADAILDWRDPDGLRRPSGAEATEYLGLQPPVRPRDGPFATPEEVREVLGIDPELSARLIPYLTTLGDGSINVNAAPLPVLATLPGVSLAGAQRLAAARDAIPFRNIYELTAALPAADQRAVERQREEFTNRVAFGPRVVELVVTAGRRGSNVGTRLRVALLLGGGSASQILQVTE